MAKPIPLTIEFPPELAKRIKAAAATESLSEGEWIVQLVLRELPSNYAEEVRKLEGMLTDKS